MAAPYVELHSHANFSFLDGGSHPYELAMRAAELEMPALAITDRGGVYGTVRHLQACRKLGVKPIIGTSLEVDGEELILIARNLRGYSNLCRLLTLAHADQPKGEARTTLDTVAEHRGELFHRHVEALATPWEIAQGCDVDLDFRKVRFPGYPVPAGETPFSFLYKLCFEGVRDRYRPITPAVAQRLQRELEVIEKTGLAEFFLINCTLMRFARELGLPVQGRGSAADSIVTYVLGITRVDPIEHNLLFERFLHEEMTSTPDIDIDFSTEHREQVIQYIYNKYGWERTGMVC